MFLGSALAALAGGDGSVRLTGLLSPPEPLVTL